MARLLHISDPHFGTEQPPVVAALQAMVRERPPDVLVLSGDLTQRARDVQFAACRHFVDSLGIAKVLVLPGNHDLPLMNLATRLFRPYANYLEAFGPRLEPGIETPDFLVIGVNTTRASLHKDGEVSHEQVERVVQQLRNARSRQLRVVVTHQPAEVMRKEDRKDRLRRAEPALQAWSAAGADLVLGGHIHLPYVIDLAARPKPTPRRMWCVQAGTAVSNRVRHDTSNSVNVIEWSQAGGARACGYERWDYDAQANAFAVKERRQLDLA